MGANYEADDFDRTVVAVGTEPSSRKLVEQLGVDWDYLTRLALDAAATVLTAERLEDGGAVAYGREAFDLRLPLTRIFEVGLAVGLELGSGGGRDARAVEET